MNVINPAPFDPTTSWPDPDMALIAPERPPAAVMSDDEFRAVFGVWAGWLKTASKVKGAPIDFSSLALVTATSAIIGNTRWARPWDGWKEPPILWGMLVGDPSSGKSPALDAVLDTIKKIDTDLAREYQAERNEWDSKDEVAKIVATKWRSDTRAALEDGNEAPSKPANADAGQRPTRKRIRVTDTTTEQAAELVRDSWRGLLLSRDELSGWLGSMDRYSGGGDRPFWLEAFGGRGYTVDRKNLREPIIVDHLAISVLGGAQPDKLDSLLVGCDDDGLLARLLMVFPDPAPLVRPNEVLDEAFIEGAMRKLHALEPSVNEHGENEPIFVGLDLNAQQALQDFREQCRVWEAGASSMMKSHIGKLPGISVRMALILAFLDYSVDASATPPTEINAGHMGRAIHYVGEHLRHHAFRAYGAANQPPEVRGANRIAQIIRDEGLTQISTREIQRRRLAGLGSAKEIGPAFKVLEEADWIAPIQAQKSNGRPAKLFVVNPKVGG